MLILSGEHAVSQVEGNLYNTRVDVRFGERYFQRQCSRCHGEDAKGNDETGAPDLTNRLSKASTDAGIFKIIRTGISGTAMLPVSQNTPDATVWQLVAFINSLNTDPAKFELTGSASRGQALYKGKGSCNSCHALEGEGARQGPDLSRIGERRDPEELLADLKNPNEEVDPRWWTIKATLNNGKTVTGLRMSEDTFTLRIIDKDSNLWHLSKNTIQSFDRVQNSTMSSYARTMNEDELNDLVAYLFSLRKES